MQYSSHVRAIHSFRFFAYGIRHAEPRECREAREESPESQLQRPFRVILASDVFLHGARAR
jgi:hypothetical protein